MDSDSAKASSVELIPDSSLQDSEFIHVSNQPNLSGLNSSAAASEVIPPELISPVGEEKGAVFNSVAEISEVVDAVTSELSPAVVEVGVEGEGNADFNVQERDSTDSICGGAAVEVASLEPSPVVPLELSSAVGEGEEDEPALIVKEEYLGTERSDSPFVGGKELISGDLLLEKEEVSMEEEDLSVAEEKREKSELREENSQAIESELGKNIESEKVDVTEAETTAQTASLEDMANDLKIPDIKEVATVAGFTEIPSQDKELDDSVLNSRSEFVEEEPLKDVNVLEDSMKKSEDEEMADAVTVLEIQTNPQEVDGLATESLDKNEASVSGLSASKEAIIDDFKDDVEKDLNAGKPMDIHLPVAAEEVQTSVLEDVGIEKEGDGMGGVEEVGPIVDLVETREQSEELAKLDETKIVEVSEETEKMIKDEDEEKVDDMNDTVENVETHREFSVVNTEDGKEDHEEMGMTETQEETVIDKIDRTKIAQVSDETETRIEDEDQEKDDDMTEVADDVEMHGDSSEADAEEGKEDHEETGMAEMTETQEETVIGKVDEPKSAEVSEETETRIEDEDQEKDDGTDDMAEDMETHGESSVADIEDGSENHEEMEMTELTETQEESVVAETGDEEPDEVEQENKNAGGKRKRVKNTKTAKGSKKKKEEDVCFMCFDGGDLVLCDRRGCPKAYHPSCVDRDEAFFRSKGKWNCGWHQCSKCEKNATYLCYTCMFSLCNGCAKDGVFFCIRGKKGLCETCMETVKLIERKEQEKEPAQLDFDDKTSWEYLFKDYWVDLKTELSLSPEELDQAKSTQKGNESHASKQGTAIETDDITDGGSDSNSSPKKRKTRSRSKSGSAEKVLSPANKSSSGETTEWASKELLDVVVHMRRGDRSYLPQSEVHVLLLDYIKRYNLRDPRRKSQVICDSRLQNLFRKSHVGHFEMLNLLETHFLKTEQQQADDIQSGSVDTEPDNVDVDENLDLPTKSGKDKKRKAPKKRVKKGRQSNLDDFAAVDMHNINLIYLRRSLVEDLLGDSTAFEEKVARAFVRLRIPGNQKQDLYRLVQVVGTSKVPEPYKVGKKTTDFVLEILNLDKTEVVLIDIISNQDFTEDECKRLKQSIKCGLITRLTVGDIQEKAIALQEVRVKNLLEAEILRFSHLRDRASDMGHRKELRLSVEKLQLLNSPEERQRRLEEIPEIHADPKMDPDCESDDEEDEKEEKEKEKYLRPRSSSFNRRGREPISPRKGGFSTNDPWTGTSNYSYTGATRELSRNYSGRGGREDYLGSSDDKVSEYMRTPGRERDVQQYLVSDNKPRSVSIPESAPRSSRTVALPELSPKIGSEISTAPSPASVPQPAPKSNESEKIWHYKDPSGKVQGPFSIAQLRKWNNTGYFPAKLEIWKANESPLDSILLTDALAGLFQKQTQSVDSSYTKAPVVAAYSGKSSQSEHNLGSTTRTAPSILDIPRNSQDTLSSGGSLPSPTPDQITTQTAKRRNFESRWSAQPAVQSMNLPLAPSGPSQASRIDIPVVLNSASSLQPGPQPIPIPDSTNVSVNHYGSVAALPSPTPAGGKQGWGSMQTDKFDSHGRRGGDAPSFPQNSSVSYGTAAPSVLPSQSQPGFPQSDSWRVPVPSQSNTQIQAPANNLQWGMTTVNNNQNPGQPQVPPNQNWAQGNVNPNMGWAAAPVQPGMNVNWAAASSVPQTGQAMPNPAWGGPVQGQPQAQAYPNVTWAVSGQGQVQSQAQVQAPVNTMGSGYMQPGQMMQPGNNNQNWRTQNQSAIPSGGSGGNQTSYWGNQQNQNGGWNRQSSGQNNFKGQRVCKFFSENGYCRKGASCNYLHN